MKPYYDEEGITLYCADAKDILHELGTDVADLVLTDPPYGLNEKMQGGTWGKKYSSGGMQDWDYKISPMMLALISAAGKHLIFWGGNYYSLPPSRCWLIWIKPPLPTLSDVELAWTNLDAPAKSFFHPRIEHNGHPTSKPVKLMEFCILQVPNAKVILDPFCGSGTTLIAAKQLNRRAIGIEISEEYCKIAVDRLSQGQFDFGSESKI